MDGADRRRPDTHRTRGGREPSRSGVRVVAARVGRARVRTLPPCGRRLLRHCHLLRAAGATREASINRYNETPESMATARVAECVTRSMDHHRIQHTQNSVTNHGRAVTGYVVAASRRFEMFRTGDALHKCSSKRRHVSTALGREDRRLDVRRRNHHHRNLREGPRLRDVCRSELLNVLDDRQDGLNTLKSRVEVHKTDEVIFPDYVERRNVIRDVRTPTTSAAKSSTDNIVRDGQQRSALRLRRREASAAVG